MKTLIAVAAAALLAGCASGPYYAAYDTYTPYSYVTPGYAPYYGSTYYGAPYYSYYPGTIGGSVYYYDRSDWRDHRDWNRHDRHGSRDWYDQDRGRRDQPRPPRDSRSRVPLDTLHGEAGNEAGMR